MRPSVVSGQPMGQNAIADGWRLRPTVFIGLGGTGVKVLARLRRRLYDRFGDPDYLPILRFLALDADGHGLERGGVEGADGLPVSVSDRMFIGIGPSEVGLMKARGPGPIPVSGRVRRASGGYPVQKTICYANGYAALQELESFNNPANCFSTEDWGDPIPILPGHLQGDAEAAGASPPGRHSPASPDHPGRNRHHSRRDPRRREPRRPRGY